MLDVAVYCALVSSISAGQRLNGRVPGARDTVYGSEGWGFESLQARLVQRLLCPRNAGPLLSFCEPSGHLSHRYVNRAVICKLLQLPGLRPRPELCELAERFDALPEPTAGRAGRTV
jgi:hypothetical protein